MAEWVALRSAFTQALRHQLRRSDPSEDFARLLSPAQQATLLAARFRPAIVLPYPYSRMIHRTVYISCFLLPFALVDSIGAMIPTPNADFVLC